MLHLTFSLSGTSVHGFAIAHRYFLIQVMIRTSSEAKMRRQLSAARTVPPGGSGDCNPGFTYTEHAAEQWYRAWKRIPHAGWETILLTSESTFILNIQLLLHLTSDSRPLIRTDRWLLNPPRNFCLMQRKKNRSHSREPVQRRAEAR